MSGMTRLFVMQSLLVAAVLGCWSNEPCDAVSQCIKVERVCVTISVTDTLTLTGTETESKTLTLPTPTETFTLPTPTSTFTTTDTISLSETLRTRTVSQTFSDSLTASISESYSISSTLSISSSISLSLSQSLPKVFTETGSHTFIPTRTPTFSLTFTDSQSTSPTYSLSTSVTPSISVTISESATFSLSLSLSNTITTSASDSLTASLSPSISQTQTATATPSPSKTATPTVQIVLPSRGRHTLNIDDLPPPVISRRDTCSCNCVESNRDNGVSCNDLDGSTYADQCLDGTCVGTLSDTINSKFVFAVILDTLATADVDNLVAALEALIDSLAGTNLIERYSTRICGSDAAGIVDTNDCVQGTALRDIKTLASTHTAVEMLTAVAAGTGTATEIVFTDGFTPGLMVSGNELTLYQSDSNIVDTPEPPPVPGTPTPTTATYGTNVDPMMVVFLIAAPILLCLVIITIVQSEHNKRKLKEAHRQLELEHEHAREVDDGFGRAGTSNFQQGRNPLPPIGQHPVDMYGDSAPPSLGPDQPDMSPRTCVADDL